MGQPKKATPEPKRRKAMDPDARQSQLCALAVDLAEEQLRNGTASSQVITHYLKLASKEEELKEKLLAEQVKLAAAKTEAIQSGKELKELYSEALKAMRIYSGQDNEVQDD